MWKRFWVTMFLLLAGASSLAATPPETDRSISVDQVHSAPRVTVRGRVERQDGRALPGARVVLRPMPRNLLVQQAILAGKRPESLTAKTEVIAHTGADGRYAVDVLNAGLFTVEISYPGFIAMRFQYARFSFLPIVESRRLPPVRLAPARATQIRVIDHNQRPVTGASIHVEPSEDKRGGNARGVHELGDSAMWRPALRVAWTDHEGIATLPRGRGEVLTTRVERPGGLRGSTRKVQHDTTIVLADLARNRTDDRVGERTVTVRDASDRPVAGAALLSTESPWPITATDGAGVARIRGPVDQPRSFLLITSDGLPQRKRIETGVSNTVWRLNATIVF